MNETDFSRWRHDHRFGQDRKKTGESRTMAVIALTFVMMIVEIAAGIAFGSMALLADGIHMASHAVALGITAFAYLYSRRHAGNPAFSFGTGKVNALGGYTGAILLAIFALGMAWESVARLASPASIAFNQALLVAVVGLVINGASVFILGETHHHEHPHHDDDHDDHGHHHHDHNLRSAYLHVLADAVTSVAAIVALLAAKYFGWIWIDPAMGLLGSLLVGRWSLGLLRQTSRTLLDCQLETSSLEKIRQTIEADGESRVTDLHAWEIGPQVYSLMVSLATRQPLTPDDYRRRFDASGFQHITVEINRPDGSPAPSLTGGPSLT
ncbi:MAG TPA: CDF family Co(II)/Ni(II) efflux transporter DmeF [Chthoniobacteraceae bacterium]|nr:CDF family Co(II)/Ni(II) efflux transporter DmeF [Chthoniobacteraceae bacterium]